MAMSYKMSRTLKDLKLHSEVPVVLFYSPSDANNGRRLYDPVVNRGGNSPPAWRVGTVELTHG